MSLSFPLSLSDFFGDLKVGSISFDLPESMVATGTTGSGEILTADTGTRLWAGEVQMAPMSYDDAEAVSAKISTLRQAGRSFFVYNMAKPGPRFDPNGAALDGATPQIKTVASDNRELTLKGLPYGYVLSPGDYLGFAYGGNPTRYALHDLVSGGTANGSGEMTVEVSSFLRPGAAGNADITLIRPFCKAVLVPGSVSRGVAAGQFITGIKFNWRQTLR
jgi:hypothetical protein